MRQRLLSPVLGPPRNRRVARGSLRSSAGILPDPNREFYAQRFRAQPSQGTGEFLLLKQASCFVVSLHLRLTPSSWPEVLVQIFRLSFSSLHAVYRSPAAAQCCCADICSDQRQEITRQLVTVNCQKLQELTRSGATDFEGRACIRGIEKVAVPHKPVSSYSFKLFASDPTIDPRVPFPCGLE